jgi:DNA primase
MLSQVTTETSAVILPPGQDPAQILTGNGAEALAAVLASGTRPLADLVTNAELERWTRWLDHPEGQLNALRAVAPVIAAMPPAHVARQVARLSHRLSLDYATVTSAVTSALSEVIVGTARPGTSTSDPWGSSGSGAQPPVHANRSGPGMPAGTSGVSAEQTTPKRDPPSRPASQDPRTGHDFPASATDAVNPANTAPRVLPASPGTPSPSHRGRVPGQRLPGR